MKMKKINIYSNFGSYMNISEIHIKKAGAFKREIIGIRRKTNVFEIDQFYTIWEGYEPDVSEIVHKINKALRKGRVDVIIKNNVVELEEWEVEDGDTNS